MRNSDWLRLIVLAAIWGGSFAFLRVIVPVLGPVLTAHSRLLLGGGVLLAWAAFHRTEFQFRRFWRQYLIIGVLNSAVPFFLFGIASLVAPAGHLAIVNSTAPMFGAAFGAIWLKERITTPRLTGLALGVLGVATVSLGGGHTTAPLWAYAAAAGAAACYALAGIYMRHSAVGAKPTAVAAASQLWAAAVFIPALPFFPAPAPLDTVVAFNLLALGIVSSGIAYLVYFHLIADIGPTRAITVTFLIPIFGILWGVLFLGETLTIPTVIGAALVLAGTALAASRR